MLSSQLQDPPDRLLSIEHARRRAFGGAVQARGLGGDGGGGRGAAFAVAPWIEASWQRCVALGHAPASTLSFDAISKALQLRTRDANHHFLRAARPVMQQLAKTVASARCFALVTDANGIVLEAAGHIDAQDRRATLLSRIGVDLSERAIGTSAIGAALYEQVPVWLHRGEHFHADNRHYSCAGSPLFNPAGRCVGMLDITGIDVPERPELAQLVDSCARAIDDALVFALEATAIFSLGWPGFAQAPGLVAVDADGWVLGLNRYARETLQAWTLSAPASKGTHPHLGELFGAPPDLVLGHLRKPIGTTFALPLWSGVQMQLSVTRPLGALASLGGMPLQAPALSTVKDAEKHLIQQAMRSAKGNVELAAKQLGMSRATLYRRLHP